MRRGESAFHGPFHACLLCEAAEFSRHVNICFVRPPEFHIKEQIMFLITKRSQPAGLSNCRLGVFIVKGLLCEIQARFTVLKFDFFSFTFTAVVSSQSSAVLLIGLSSATNSS